MRLSPIACRVLGALAEKRLTTPNQYPLSVAALATACNQRSARDPVMELTERDVQQGLHELRDEGLARTSPVRGRVAKHEHTLDVQLDLSPPDQTVLGVLLLRGPQTVGEIRTRTDRWVTFASLEAVQQVLERLAEHPFLPLVAELPREPGRRESRWTHLLGDPDAIPAAAAAAEAAAGPSTTARDAPSTGDAPSTRDASSTADTPSMADAPSSATATALSRRVDELETQVATLTAELTALRDAVTPILEELS